MKTVYIAGPYRAKNKWGILKNIWKARTAAKVFWKRGYAVLCPHMNSAFMDGVVPDNVFLQGDHEFVRMCDIVVMLPGWAQSKGARMEHVMAISEHKEIIYWDDAEVQM